MSEVQFVDVTNKVPKESKEMVDLAFGVIEKVMAKAPLAEYIELVGKLNAAIEGADKAGAEFKSDGRDELAGYVVQKSLATFLPVK